MVDLVVGSALFRETFVEPVGHGHVDLPRLRAGGVNVVGLTVATRHPDLRGTLSNIHLRSLGLPRDHLSSDMAIATWVIERIHRWVERSRGEMRLLRTEADLDACLADSGPIGVFICVQGGHVLEGDLRNVERLRALAVRMLAPAHVMDNPLVGSGTGRGRGPLTAYGREVIAELERARVVVDLAHMSAAGARDCLDVVSRPFVMSHTGLLESSGAERRWRRYSPATRNVSAALAGDIAAAGGVVGIVLASELLGGETIDAAVSTIRRAMEACGPANVALGSDMDGGLRTVCDAAGVPLITEGLLAAGLPVDDVRQFLGGNAVRLLRSVLAAAPEEAVIDG